MIGAEPVTKLTTKLCIIRFSYCLLTSLAAVQADDVRASLMFVDDLNGHHEEW